MGVFGRKELLSENKLEDVPFAVPVTPIHGSPTKVVGLDGWPDDVQPRNIRYRVTLMESALELCRQGRAASFLPKFVVDLHNRKVKEHYHLSAYSSLDLPARYLQQAVYIIKRKSHQENRTVHRLARALRMACKG
jgi:DNA-binding transcriptional LysR family regulator